MQARVAPNIFCVWVTDSVTGVFWGQTYCFHGLVRLASGITRRVRHVVTSRTRHIDLQLKTRWSIWCHGLYITILTIFMIPDTNFVSWYYSIWMVRAALVLELCSVKFPPPLPSCRLINARTSSRLPTECDIWDKKRSSRHVFPPLINARALSRLPTEYDIWDNKNSSRRVFPPLINAHASYMKATNWVWHLGQQEQQ